MKSVSTEVVKVRCPVCAGSLRPGLLWLGGGDYLECPSCDGGTLTINEYKLRPIERTISIPKKVA